MTIVYDRYFFCSWFFSVTMMYLFERRLLVMSALLPVMSIRVADLASALICLSAASWRKLSSELCRRRLPVWTVGLIIPWRLSGERRLLRPLARVDLTGVVRRRPISRLYRLFYMFQPFLHPLNVCVNFWSVSVHMLHSRSVPSFLFGPLLFALFIRL